MPPASRALLGTAAKFVPGLLVLAVLAGVGWWGATHDWQIGADSEDKENAAKAEKKAEEKDPNTLQPIRLDSAQAAEHVGIEVVPAEQQTLNEYISANGEVDYDQNRLAHLASRVAGTVWSVERREGDVVVKGDVLALVSAADVGKAKAEFLQALVDYQLKSKLFERVQSAAGSIPERQVREAGAQLREAHIRLFSAQQSLLNLGLEVRLEDVLKKTDERVVQQLRVLGLPQSVLRRVDVDTLTNNLVPISAPFDGLVVKRDLVVGEPVNTTAAHFTVADLRKVWVMLNVRLEHVGKVALGQEIFFQTEGFNDAVPSGRLTWVSAEVDDKTHTLAVRAEVPNPGGRLRPHSFGTGRIRVGQRTAVIVPNEAVQWDASGREPNERLVFIRISPTAFQPRRVQVGQRGERFTEIITGVQAGDPVAATGSHVLKSEMSKHLISTAD